MSTTPIAPEKERLVHVVQGEYAVSGDPNTVMTTVLGSCVATMLYDPNRGVGGMNHFLLPDNGGDQTRTTLFGVNLMELMINDLLKLGASRPDLRAKVFGGACMLRNITNIGDRNAAFAKRFLADEGIPCLAESLGGEQARRVRFWPTSGQAKQRLMPADQLSVQEVAPKTPPKRPAPSDDIELF